MACKWILLIPPSCNPVMQPLQSGSIYNQATATQQQQHFQHFQQPQQFTFPSIQEPLVPRAYPLTQLPPAYRGNPRVPPLQEYKTNNNFPGRVVKNLLWAERNSENCDVLINCEFHNHNFTGSQYFHFFTTQVQDGFSSQNSDSAGLCEPVNMPCFGNGSFVHGTICKTKCQLRGEIERRKCVCRKNECYWRIIRKCTDILTNGTPTDEPVQAVQAARAVEQKLSQISVLKVATGFKDQLLAAFQDLCSQKGQSCLFTFNET